MGVFFSPGPSCQSLHFSSRGKGPLPLRVLGVSIASGGGHRCKQNALGSRSNPAKLPPVFKSTLQHPILAKCSGLVTSRFSNRTDCHGSFRFRHPAIWWASDKGRSSCLVDWVGGPALCPPTPTVITHVLDLFVSRDMKLSRTAASLESN